MTTRSKKVSTIEPEAIPQEEVVVNAYENLPPIAFHVGYVVIGVTGKGKAITRIGLDRWDLSAGLLNGMMDASVGFYPVLEPGLHLKYDLETLFAKGYQPNAGYVLQTYQGENLDLFAEPLRAGWWSIGFIGGQFVFEFRCNPTRYAKDEADWITKSRNAFWKHSGFDLLLKGNPISLHYYAANEWAVKFIATKKAQAEMSVAARKVSIQEKVTGKRAWNMEQNVEAAFSKGYTPTVVLASIRLHDGGEVSAKDLVGKKITKWVGTIPVSVVALTEGNLAVQLEAIRRQNMTVSLD